jgi:hypothetical protein
LPVESDPAEAISIDLRRYTRNNRFEPTVEFLRGFYEHSLIWRKESSFEKNRALHGVIVRKAHDILKKYAINTASTVERSEDLNNMKHAYCLYAGLIKNNKGYRKALVCYEKAQAMAENVPTLTKRKYLLMANAYFEAERVKENRAEHNLCESFGDLVACIDELKLDDDRKEKLIEKLEQAFDNRASGHEELKILSYALRLHALSSGLKGDLIDIIIAQAQNNKYGQLFEASTSTLSSGIGNSVKVLAEQRGIPLNIPSLDETQTLQVQEQTKAQSFG